MKLIFKKDADQDISIQLTKGATTFDFTYVEMIKSLLIDNTIEEPVFEGSVTDEEKEKIKAMLQKISEAISEGGDVNN